MTSIGSDVMGKIISKKASPPAEIEKPNEEVAYHEAGHLVMARIIGAWDFEFATIEPGQNYLGRVRSRVAMPVETMHPRQMAMEAMLFMAGHAAVTVLVGGDLWLSTEWAEYLGYAGDYQRAMDLARRLHPKRPERYLDLLTLLTARTLAHCWSSVERVATALMTQGTIADRDKLARLVEGRGGRRGRVLRVHDLWCLGCRTAADGQVVHTAYRRGWEGTLARAGGNAARALALAHRLHHKRSKGRPKKKAPPVPSRHSRH